MSRVSITLTTIQAVINKEEVDEMKANLREPFPNLFVGQMPSVEEEVGYEVQDNKVIIKYEFVDSERKMIRSNLTHQENGYATNLPRIFGVICEIHKVQFLQIGSSIMSLQVHVNDPDGKYAYTQQSSSRVLRHDREGLVFTRDILENYEAVEDDVLKALLKTYVGGGYGMAIPGRYTVRFKAGNEFRYYPLSSVFTDPVVATSLHKEVPVEYWADIKNKLTSVME